MNKEENRKLLVEHIYKVINEYSDLINDKLYNIIYSVRVKQIIDNKQWFLLLEVLIKGTGQQFYKNINGLDEYQTKNFSKDEIKKLKECIEIVRKLKNKKEV